MKTTKTRRSNALSDALAVLSTLLLAASLQFVWPTVAFAQSDTQDCETCTDSDCVDIGVPCPTEYNCTQNCSGDCECDQSTDNTCNCFAPKIA
jgi:hypothetical protein